MAQTQNNIAARESVATKEPELQLSPMMKQYWELKSQNPEALLFFRLGDFYELFDEDAHVGARELDITLTGRPEPAYPTGRVPMAGVPVKAADMYIAKLLAKGYSVAVSEQVGQAGAGKGPIERQLTRILTPGTVLESDLLPAKENNFLVCIVGEGKTETNEPNKERRWGLAVVDASCGEFAVTQLKEEQLLMEIGRISPREILAAKRTVKPGPGQVVQQDILDAPKSLQERYHITGRPAPFFQLEPCKRRIMQAFNLSTLEGFGCKDMPLAIAAAGAVFEYLERTQGSQMPQFAGIASYTVGDYMTIDETTKKNLELLETSRDRSFQGSLLWCLDRSKTAMGSRTLRSWLLKPSLSVSQIQERQNAIEELLSFQEARHALTDEMSGLADLERLSVRLTSGTTNPRDLAAIRESLRHLPHISRHLHGFSSSYLTALSTLPEELAQLEAILEKALAEEPPRETTLGGIFRAGYSAELDEIRELLGGGKQWLDSFQKCEQERTQIRSLKVSFNSNFGYYIEVTHANKNAVPADYIRKQTLTNAERYITPELKEYEAKILNAEKNQTDLEYRLFVELRATVQQFGPALRQVAKAIAELDAILALAVVAFENRYVRPTVDTSLILDVKDGRHPVLERILPRGLYVSNDSLLCGNSERNQMIILTGPNMAGKSSLLRQVALITILAQMGSFVPCREARIGLVDRIFTRIGAVDDLTQGQSTFLVEMSETTQCCLSATERSLVLLDEVGRGTSTYDGVAIAWSVAEYLTGTVKARTIFATHYHELNGLATFFPQISNFQVMVSESQGQIEFMHRVAPGGASRSFGINVASMAGLPKTIIDRANYLMAQMEKKGAASKILDGPKLKNIAMDEVMQLSLFNPGAQEVNHDDA